MKVKVRAIEHGDKIEFVVKDFEDAGIMMELMSNTHVPHKQYNDELYPIRFEVETVPDPEEEMTEEEFNDLEELLKESEVEEIPVEEVAEGVE